MIDRETLIRKLNGLCWDARRYGHDDYGLDWGVGLDGKSLEDDNDEDIFHPEAVRLADELLALLS